MPRPAEGKRPKALVVNHRPRATQECDEFNALYDVLQAAAHESGYSGHPEMTVRLWYDIAEQYVHTVEQNPHASEEQRAIVAQYRRYMRPVNVQGIVASRVRKAHASL